AVEAEVRNQPPPTPDSSTPSQGVFVTIERQGKILGCRGSLTALEPTLEQETILAARAAAKHDTRYKPLQFQDLTDYLVTVTVVQRLQPTDTVNDLQPS